MKLKCKLISALIAFAATCVAATSIAAYAMPRDPNGDGMLTALDGLYTQQFLAGMIPSYNLNALDVDQNGIVSRMDSDKILNYLTNRDNVHIPDAPANDDTATLQTIQARTYRKHSYSSSSATSYTSYPISKYSVGTNANYDCMPTAIIGDNNMVRDTDTAVVRLRNAGITGTGFIVGEHVIATAAHCAYNRTGKTFIDNNIEIVDENNNVIDSFHAESVHVPSGYFTSTDLKYDYALLYVPSIDLSDYGMFSLGIAKDEYIDNTNNQVIVSGFPGAGGYPNGYGDADYGLRFKASGNVKSDSNPYRLSYNTDTAGGDSGGPVYVEEGFSISNGGNTEWNEYKTVVGIHTHSGNSGVRITPELLAFYNYNKNL